MLLTSGVNVPYRPILLSVPSSNVQFENIYGIRIIEIFTKQNIVQTMC